jgi:hypothetical protein
VDLQILSQSPDAGEFTLALDVAPYEALTCLAAAAHQVTFWLLLLQKKRLLLD